MLRLILNRLVGGVLVVVAVAAISFFLLHRAPGGPFDAERNLPVAVQRNIEARYHLDQPEWKQFATYMEGTLLHFDLGHSMKKSQTVNEIVSEHFAYSLTIGLMALMIAVVLGVSMGVVAAWKRNTWVDYLLMSIALLGISVPSIVLGPMFIAFFALKLGWLPTARIEGLSSYVMPAMVLGLIYTGAIARLSRGGMIETLGQDFIRTARAKGLSEARVVWKHGVRVGLIPVITYLGPASATLITGSFVVEKIFGVPGLGSFFVTSITNRDYPVLSGLLVFYVAFVVVLNLVTEILHGLLDPRVAETR